MNRFTSQKFRFFSFIAIAMLVFVHGYNLNENYLRPFSAVTEKMTFTTWLEYFLANGLLRFRIPILFIISGYIFALQDQKPYGQRIVKRFRSLLIPFLIWSALALAFTFLLQQFSFTAKLVANAGIDQLGDNRPYTEVGWQGILTRWVFAPPAFQLWFIRVLFIYNLLYPGFRWLVTRFTIPWFIICFALFFLAFNYMYLAEGQGILFFSLGIWLQKSNFPLERPPRWFSLPLAWLFFVGCSVIKTFMAFELEPYAEISLWTLNILYVSSIIAGIMAAWYGLDAVVRWCMNRKWFVRSASYSFFIYAMHVPLLSYLTQYFFYLFSDFQYHRLLIYFLAPLCTLSLCFLCGFIIKRTMPSVYKLITGGRGF